MTVGGDAPDPDPIDLQVTEVGYCSISSQTGSPVRIPVAGSLQMHLVHLQGQEKVKVGPPHEGEAQEGRRQGEVCPRLLLRVLAREDLGAEAAPCTWGPVHKVI